MALIQTVHLSMANFKSAPVVPAVQNDTDRQVKMIIDDYTLTSGLTGKIAFERSDGTHYETAAELVLADNAFTADIDQALTQPGRTMVQLKVTDTLTVSTFSFVIFVEADNSGTVTPQEGIDLVSAVEAAEDEADRAEAAADRAEAAEASGLSDQAKQALLACFANVAWINDDGQDYYDALEDALYPVTPPATLVSISAVYTQTGTVYNTDSLDSLKADLVVTGHYDDSTTAVILTGYTLSGTLTVGTSTITVSYGGQTTTFNVVVSDNTLLYSLPQVTVFDGTNIIDTGVQLFNQASDTLSWTILAKVTFDTSNTALNVFGVNTWVAAGKYNGVYFNTGSTSAGARKVSVGFNGKTASLGVSGQITSGEHTYKIAIVHTAGNNTVNIWASIDGTTTLATKQTLTPGTDNIYRQFSSPIYIGGVASGSASFIGTVNSLQIYSAALSDANIESFMTED